MGDGVRKNFKAMNFFAANKENRLQKAKVMSTLNEYCRILRKINPKRDHELNDLKC